MADGGGRDPTNVIKKARLVDDREFQDFCSKIHDLLRGSDRGTECTSQLRRLFLLIAATRKRRRIPNDLIEELKSVSSEPQQGSKKLKLLSAAILREVTPTKQLAITNFEPPVDQKDIPVILPLTLVQGRELGYWSNHLPQIVRWLTKGGIPVEVQTTALGFLNLIFYSHKHLLSQVEDVSAVCSQMAHWLRNASTVSAPNPFQRQIFGGSKAKGYQCVSEIDGTASRFFFTVLSIAHYCFPDQILNIHCFSMLRPWLINSHALQGPRDDVPSCPPQQASPISTPIMTTENPSKSPSRNYSPSQDTLDASRTSLDNLSLDSQSSSGFFIPMSQSPSGQSGTQSPALGQSPDDRPPSGQFSGLDNRPPTPLSFPLTAEDSGAERAPTPKRGPQRKISRNVSFTKLFPHSNQQGPKTGQQELQEKACEYCLRVLEQNERKPSKVQDAILLEATVIEAVYTLDLLCGTNKSLVPKLIEMIRRLYGRITGDMNKWKRVMLPVVQFFLNHGEAVVFDAEPACKLLFGTMVNAYYYSSSFAFEVVMFCLNNKEKLCISTSAFTIFFPNLFKILAWFPRTFLREFIELLPVMMSEDTAVEIFHSILDLACQAAAMCAYWSARGKSSSSSDTSSTALSSTDAFSDPKYKPMFSFILRPEAGHGDTISRLGSLHSLLSDMVEHPRVVVSSQIVTTLLSTYFTILLEEADKSIVSRLVPVILERSVLLYNVQNSERLVRRLLAEKLVLIFQTYPSLVATHQQDMVEFISGMKNLGPEKEDFFINVVWSIGEYASTIYERGCTVQMIVQYFESLEALTYEIVMQTSPGKVPFSGKLISVLTTALAKLASRCQDLVQRAILCCSKIIRQKPEMLTDAESYRELLTRAQELINLLKLPNVAPVILSPQSEWVTGRWHRDRNASLPLLLQATKVIVS